MKWTSGHGWEYRLSDDGDSIERRRHTNEEWARLDGTISTATVAKGMSEFRDAALSLLLVLKKNVTSRDGRTTFTQADTESAVRRLEAMLTGAH